MGEQAQLSAKEVERLDGTFEMLPRDARNALEIGFNDLRVTRMLAARMSLVSVDVPRPIPADAAEFSLAFANIRALPFPDRQFDLVVCTEVLEHLPDDVLRQGVTELARVSRRYLLVSVPFEERVWNGYFRCTSCGHFENSMGHVRRLSRSDLVRFFPGFAVSREALVSTEPGYAPDWLYAVARRAGNVWYPTSAGACPRCGSRSAAPLPNALGWVLQRIIWRLEARQPRRPAWIVMLLDRGASMC